MAETIVLKPADLQIDEQNPRIPPSRAGRGQNEALRALAQHLGRKLQKLAEDVVGHGLNPSELPIVTRQPGSVSRYIVREGNRRLAALRALENPEWLTGAAPPGVASKIRRLSREYLKSPIEDVTCCLMTEDEARHWIEIRHTGENEGRGIVRWNTDETDRWRARRKGGRLPGIHFQVLNWLEERGDLTPERRLAVPVTSLKRLIETPAVREPLAVEVEAGMLMLRADENRVARALMHVIDDLTDRRGGIEGVKSIYTLAQREQYAQNLPRDVVVRPTREKGQGVLIGGSYPTERTGGRSRSRAAARRDRVQLIPRECSLNIADARLRHIEGELRTLRLKNHPNAISVLFRVFLELSADFYRDLHKIAPGPKSKKREDDSLSWKLRTTVDDLISRGKLTEQQARPVRRAYAQDTFLAPSVRLMQDYVHNPNVFPSEGDLRTSWNNLERFISTIWTQ